MAAPDARTDNYSVIEDQLLVGSAHGFLNNDSDPDGDPLRIILIDGRPFSSFGTPITLASGAKLTINADGSFQYDQNGSFTHLSAGQTVNDIFTYTISDARGGTDTSAVCMTISGVGGVIQNQPLIINGAISDVVEEEHGLPGGNEDTTDSNDLDTDESGPNTVTNASAGSFVPLITGGIDGTLSFAFAPLGGNPAVQTVSNGPLTSDGKQIYFDTEGPNLIGYYNANGDSSDYDPATDTKVFTITLASTGAYIFTLHAPVDQPIGGEDNIAINLNGRVTVTDSGGPGADTNVPLNASITVIDDTPLIGTPTAALAGELTLDESPVDQDEGGDFAPAGLKTVTANFADNFAAASPSYGADGPGSTSLAFELSSEGLGSGLYALDNMDTTRGAATAVLSNVGATWHVVAAADFNGDGKSDILWQGDDGTAAMWLMDGTNATFVGAVGPFNPGPTWHIKGTGDFNGDGKSDILWQGDDGTAAMWLMDGTNATFVGAVGPFNPGPSWEIKGTGDFNGDGKSDVLWQGDDGTAAMWLMDGPNATFVGAAGPFNPGPSWEIKGTGDFNGDGKSDILWQGDDGTAAMWLMDGANATFVGAVGPFNPGPSWEIKGTGDFNGDGKSDIIWQGDDGTAAMWLMDGTNATFVGAVGPFNPGQKIKGTGDFNGDAKADILWQNDSGLPSIWTMVGATDTDGIGQGDEILLYVSADGTTVTGSTAATEADITAANTYFTITVDNNPASPTFGDVTFSQTQNIWHDDTNDPDDPEALTTAAAGDLTLTLTVTDADGDTDSASINLGAGVFVIQDDGPNAVVIGTPAAIVLDETRPLGTDSVGGVPPTGVASATEDFSANFAASNFGTDGASSARYALVLTGASVASGLFALDAADTTAGDGDGIGQGASIVLNKVDNDILGQVGAVTYFTISVDGSGVVTFTQLKNIWHPNTGSNDEAATLTLSDPALLQLTVMDADGDTASAALNLGAGVFTIQDDGPQANNDGTFTVTEGTPLLISTALDNDLFGADAVVLATGVAVTTAAAKGAAVYNGDGTFTYTATAGQEGLDTFQYTITDQDGDTSTATVTVDLGTDSVPSLVSVTNLEVDEDGFANAANDTVTARTDETDSTELLTATGTAVVNFGSDVPANLLASIVLVDTPALDGQLQTHDGQSVTFALDGSGDLVGSAGATAVIRIHLVSAAAGPAAGDVTYTYSTTLLQPLEHADGALENAITLTGVTVQVTDSDTDTLPVSFDVTIIDDVPQANNDGTFTVTEGTPLLISTALDNDLFGADAVVLATGVAVTTAAAKGAAVYNGDGTFTYTATAGQEGLDTFQYTITDQDGDTSTATVTVDLGTDSVPSLVSVTNLEVDEDGFANAANDTVTARTDETDSTELLTATGTAVVNFGSDVPANLLASIVLVDTPALDGQLQTHDGQSVTFALDGSGDLVGSAGATAVIRIHLVSAAAGPAAGDVTYTYSTTLLQPLEHADGALENAITLTGVTVQVTDSDTDTLPVSFDVTIIDDVPQAVADTAAAEEDTAVTYNVITNADGTSDLQGADAPTTLTAATLATAGAGTVGFLANGAITFTPAAGFAGAAVINYTITDQDGDTSSSTLTVTVAPDSVPSVVSTTNLTVDEDGFLATRNLDQVPPAANETDSTESLIDASGIAKVTFGNDVPANLLTSIKLVDTAALDGQLQTHDGQSVTFALDGSGDLVGSAGATEVIRIHITGASLTNVATGEVSYTYSTTLSQPIKHTSLDGQPLDNSENSALLSGVTFEVTDNDADTTQGTFSVTIVDDIALPIAPDPLVGSNVAGASATAFLDSDDNIDNNVGADQLGTVRFPASLNPDSGLTSGGVPIIYTVSSDGLVLTGTAAGSTVFTITLNPDGDFAGTNDTYTLNMSGIVDTESTINFDEGTHDFTGGNTAWAGFVPNGQGFGQTPVPDGSDDLLLTPVGVGTTINGNANAAGVSGGSGSGLGIGSGEAIRLDYVNDLTGNPAGSGGYDDPLNHDHVFADHYEVNGALVSIGGINAGSAEARFTAKDDPDTGGDNVVGDGTPDPVTSVAIRFGAETKVVALASPFVNPVMVGGHAFTIIGQADGSVIVGGLVNGASIATYTADGFNSLEVAYVSGNPFIITGFGTASVLSAPVSFNVPVEVVDADGDAASGNLGITLAPPEGDPLASVHIAASLLTEPNASSLVTIQFTEAVTGFDVSDLGASGGVLSPGSFHQIDADTYGVSFTAIPNFDGTGQVILTGAYTDLALNPGITGADDTVDVNTLTSTLDATILTTGTSGLGQTVALTFVDLQNPIFSYAGLYDLGAQGGIFQRDAGFNIDDFKEYAVTLEATTEFLVPVSVLSVEGVTIHIQDTVGLQLDNDNSILLNQTALTSIIVPQINSVPHQFETASVDGNAADNNALVDPSPASGSGAGAVENSVNYLYGADGRDDLTGSNDTDVLNGGTGNDNLGGNAGNDVLIYDPADQKIDGGDGIDVLRTDEAALGLLNNVGVMTDAATGFSLVEVVPFKQNIKNVEVLLITDDAESSPTKGGLLNLTAKDVLDMTDPIDHTLHVLGNPGDLVNLGIGVSAWNDNGKALDANGFHTFTQTFDGINLILKVEHDVVVQDSMNGGAGADTDVATSINESGNTDLTADVISGWDSTDVIDLSGIDAISSVDANEHASVPESIPNHELPQAALDHMNEFFPPQHPEQPAEHHSPSATGFDHMTDAAREQLQVHHPDWFVI